MKSCSPICLYRAVFVGVFAFAALSQASLWAQPAQPDCVSIALSGYVRAKGVKSSSCIVNLDRTNLANPATITVPKGTTVILRMTNTHWTETVQFSTATTEAQDQDAALCTNDREQVEDTFWDGTHVRDSDPFTRNSVRCSGPTCNLLLARYSG
jgi:hypothetical protein